MNVFLSMVARSAVSAGAAMLVCTCVIAAESVAPGINDRYATEEGREAAVEIFEGEDRDTYQKPEEIVRQLHLEHGDAACEIGAGTGYFTTYLARAVGPSGRVYAEDPQKEFVQSIEGKIERGSGLDNVVPVVGSYVDTNLPDGACDVAIVLDAYHHFEWPAPMLDAMAKDMKSDGRLVIIDFYRKQNPLFDRIGIDAKQHLRLDRDEVIAEIEKHGWQYVESRAFLPYQYFLVFTPPQSP
jgi:ubiquinone/menaquinone biosynthesis C-methylase UbiE